MAAVRWLSAAGLVFVAVGDWLVVGAGWLTGCYLAGVTLGWWCVQEVTTSR